MSIFRSRSLYVVIACALVSSLSTSCERKEQDSGKERESADMAGGKPLLENRLEGLPGNVFLSQKDSPIHWHPYGRDTLELAHESDRLIFAVVVKGSDPGYLEALEILGRNEARVREINESYLPVLIDVDVMREFGILSAILCSEIRSPFQLPLLLWMSSEGNPVAWLPVANQSEEALGKMLAQSNEMLESMWENEEKYINENSSRDMEGRSERLQAYWKERELSEDPKQDGAAGLRQLIALYDPMSRSLDETEYSFPTHSMNLLALGAKTRGLPEHLREGAREVLSELLTDMVTSPMFDPIDGSAFSARSGKSWTMPNYFRDCVSQAEIADSLFRAYEVTGDERALHRALGILKYIEETYRTKEGVFSFSTSGRANVSDWLWEYSQLDGVLTGDEKKVWTTVTGMKPGGNISAEADPSREYGSKNSIGISKTLDETAEETGLGKDVASGLFESARKKLADIRRQRISSDNAETSSHAASTFRTISAYASAYRVTGERVFRDQAVNSLSAARKIFFNGVQLSAYPQDGVFSETNAARALLYAIALNAILDVYEISEDEAWLTWSDDISTVSAEKFTSGVLRECDPQFSLLNTEICDIVGLSGTSSLGEFSVAEARMRALGRPVLPSFSENCRILPAESVHRPTLYADSIAASILRDWVE
ncbi:DUF255 domain-containing protein [Luteolibacter sp. AS25]|uniref:DUF255 domain-containing protein n=1 Tax=Luteolibacter sp. AS25 TaxID=3135776 RepID=UPI00398BA0E2